MEERIIFKIEDDLNADIALESLRELQEEVTRLERVTEARMERLMEGFKSKSLPLREQIMSLENELKAYFSTVKTKDTKTLRKYPLPSGVLVEKKQGPTFKQNNDKLLSFAKGFFTKEYIKVEEKPIWENIKKDTIIRDGKVWHKDTGEVVDGVEVVEREPKFEIR